MQLDTAKEGINAQDSFHKLIQNAVDMDEK